MSYIKDMKATQDLKNEQRQHPESTQSVLHQLCHCCKLGFVCLLDVVSRAFDHLWVSFFFLCVCKCVACVCFLVSKLGQGWGPGGSFEWQAPSALFDHMVQLMLNIRTAVFLNYIHIYTFSCVYMLIVQTKTTQWRTLQVLSLTSTGV